ncbi:MAG: hypothetical protein ACT4N2_03460 [Hyphomicrobium sp.]
MASTPSGAVSASLVILILVAAAIGAVVALMLQDTGLSTRAIAVIAGFVATIAASIARYKVIFLGAGKGPDESRIPNVVVIYAAIASMAGSLAAHDLNGVSGMSSTVFLGALAGLLSAVLMAMLMITYHTNPRP